VTYPVTILYITPGFTQLLPSFGISASSQLASAVQ
jgi:hypothetical protein